MSDQIYIKDAFGKSIPMLDEHGNLTLEVLMLYTEDKLAEEDRKTVDSFAAEDEMSRDALEGFALTGNPSKTRYMVAQLAGDIQARTGAAGVTQAHSRTDFNYMRIAAAVAALFLIGGATFFGAQYFGQNELADNSAATTETVSTKKSIDRIDRSNSEVVSVDSFSEEVANDPILGDRNDVEVVEEDLQRLESGASQTGGMAAVAPVEQEEVELAVVSEPEMKTANVSLDLPESASDARSYNDDMPSDSEEADRKQDAFKDEETDADGSADVALAKAGYVPNEGNETNTGAEAKQKRKEWLASEAENRKASREAEKARKETESSARKRVENEELVLSKAAARQESRMAMEQQAVTSEQLSEAMSVGTDTDPADETIPPVNAKYPGGDLAMYKFIEKKKNYTQAMQAQGLKGNVVVTFDVEENGRVTNVRLKTGVSGLLNEDALRVVRSMPKWNAAKKRGNAVRSTRSVLIKYGE